MSKRGRLKNSEEKTKRYEVLLRPGQVKWLTWQEGNLTQVIQQALNWFILKLDQTRDTETTREKLFQESQHGQNLKPIQIRMKPYHHEELTRLSKDTGISKSQWVRVVIDFYRGMVEESREDTGMDPLEAVKGIKGKAFRPASRQTVRLETDESIVSLLEKDTMPEMTEEKLAECARQDEIAANQRKTFQQEILDTVGSVPLRETADDGSKILLKPHDRQEGTQFVEKLIGVFGEGTSQHATEMKETLEKMLDV